MRRLIALTVLLALVAGAAGYAAFGESDRESAATCPKQARAGWQRLANRIDAPVYCPSWLPDPLTAEIGGPYSDINSVDRDRSYLISFLWKERVEEIHVNLRGYPGRASVPRCIDTLTVSGVTRRRRLPCFSDSQGEKRVGGKDITVYRVNRDADAWHVLYAWHDDGSLYTLSEHVALPFTHAKVVQNLDRMMRGLARIEPQD